MTLNCLTTMKWKFGKGKLITNRKELYRNAPKFGFCIPITIAFGIKIVNYIRPVTFEHVKGIIILIGNTNFVIHKAEKPSEEEKRKWQAFEYCELHCQ